MFPLRARYIAEAIDLERAVHRIEPHQPKDIRRLRNRTLYDFGGDRYLVTYSFGVVATVNVPEEERHELAKALRPALTGAEHKGWADEYAIEVDPALAEDVVEFDRVRVRSLTPDLVDIACRVLAQSVAITQYDIEVDRMVDQFKQLYGTLRATGRPPSHITDLLKSIGANYDIIRAIIADLALLNAPHQAWDDRELERLWLKLREHFDLDDRFERLEFKLGYLRESSTQLLAAVQARRAEFLEAAIVALFIIDIVLVLYELFK
jgi:uncharacterized Rmd1/YagE family protein